MFLSKCKPRATSLNNQLPIKAKFNKQQKQEKNLSAFLIKEIVDSPQIRDIDQFQ